LLSKYKTPTKEMISNIINIELSFINTNHPDFVGGDGAITAILERMAKVEADKESAKNAVRLNFKSVLICLAKPTTCASATTCQKWATFTC
jgi:hypothetical protein